MNVDKVVYIQDSAVWRWIQANRHDENFDQALRTLVSYACAEWIRRCSGCILGPVAALSKVALSVHGEFPLMDWLESAQEHLPEIADFCEKTKKLHLPTDLNCEFPGILDLRGVHCPRNAARARLVMDGYPEGRTLEILLDDGSPIENVPGALVADGHKVVFREKKADYWILKVVKLNNKE